MSSAKHELVSEYLARIKEQNSKENKVFEYRPNFFLVPKENNMMLMQKRCNPKVRINNTYLYYMEKSKSIQNVDLTSLTPKELEEFFLEHQDDFKIYSDVIIGEAHNYLTMPSFMDFDLERRNYLSILKVHQYFRHLGLSKKLLNQIKSENITNGISFINAKMSPLDNFLEHDPEFIQTTRVLSDILGANKTASYKITIHDLAKIYTNLGFRINKYYELEPRIVMSTTKDCLKPEDKYPDYYSEFYFHDEVPTLVK